MLPGVVGVRAGTASRENMRMEPNTSDFQQKLRDIKRRFPRGRGGDVWGIGIDCSFLISKSPMIDVVRVQKPMGDPYLIIALCRVRSGEFSAQQLSGEIKRLWTNEIWPPSFGPEAHQLAVTDDEVRMEFVAAKERGRYVTGLLVVSRHAVSA